MQIHNFKTGDLVVVIATDEQLDDYSVSPRLVRDALRAAPYLDVIDDDGTNVAVACPLGFRHKWWLRAVDLDGCRKAHVAPADPTVAAQVRLERALVNMVRRRPPAGVRRTTISPINLP